MRSTLTALSTAVLLACSGAAHAAPEAGSFIGSGSTQFFGFEIDYTGLLTGSVLSSFTGVSGYDITSVTIDGTPLLDSLPAVGDDLYSFSLTVSPGEHLIAVKGKSFGGFYVGSYTITPVPEASSAALLLGGLGAVWAVSRLRTRRQGGMKT